MKQLSVLFVDDYIDPDIVADVGIDYLCYFTVHKYDCTSMFSINDAKSKLSLFFSKFDFATRPFEAVDFLKKNKYDLVCLDGGFDYIWSYFDEHPNEFIKPGCIMPMSIQGSRNMKTEEHMRRHDIPHFDCFKDLWGFHFNHRYGDD
jgi:hypothetical protein